MATLESVVRAALELESAELERLHARLTATLLEAEAQEPGCDAAWAQEIRARLEQPDD